MMSIVIRLSLEMPLSVQEVAHVVAESSGNLFGWECHGRDVFFLGRVSTCPSAKATISIRLCLVQMKTGVFDGSLISANFLASMGSKVYSS